MSAYTEFYLHMGGQISYGVAGFQYDISDPNAVTKRLRLKNKPTLPELKHKIHVKLGLGVNVVISRIIYKSPLYNRGSLCWTSVDIADDDDVDMIYEKLREYDDYNIVELCIQVTEMDTGGYISTYGMTDQLRNENLSNATVEATQQWCENDVGPSQPTQPVSGHDIDIFSQSNYLEIVGDEVRNMDQSDQRRSVSQQGVAYPSRLRQSVSRRDGDLIVRDADDSSRQGHLRRSCSHVPDARMSQPRRSVNQQFDVCMDQPRRSMSEFPDSLISQPRRSFSRRVGDFFSNSIFGRKSRGQIAEQNYRRQSVGPSQSRQSVRRQDGEDIRNETSIDLAIDDYYHNSPVNNEYVSPNDDDEALTANLSAESDDSDFEAGNESSGTQYVSPLASVEVSGSENNVSFNFPSEHYIAINFDASQIELEHGGQFGTWNGTSELSKGLVFNSKDEVKSCVKKYSISRNVDFRVVESKTKFWVVKCANADSGCKWRLRASTTDRCPFWTITKYEGPHSCLSTCNLSKDHRQLGSQIIRNSIMGMVSKNPSLPIDVIIAAIKEQFHYEVSYYKAWYAKTCALEAIFGNYVESFQKLSGFLYGLKFYNPGSVYEFVLEDTYISHVKQFKRIFWSFKPAIDGFIHCKPILLIDGTFLTGKFHQTLLVASSVDGNNMLFPIVFAVVESENKSSWAWFMNLIRKYVTQRVGITVISDRHAGIMAVFRDERSGWKEPLAFHRICLRHFVSNYNTHHRKATIKNLIYNAGNTYEKHKFIKQMEEIKQLDEESYNWAMRVPLERWTLSEDGGYRYGHTTTNIAESVNSALKGVRMMPITAIVEHIFGRLVKFYDQRRGLYMTKIGQGMRFTPKCVEVINKRAVKAREHTVVDYDSRYKLFRVIAGRTHSDNTEIDTYILSLDKRECECGKFQGTKMPCSHAIAACMHKHIDMYTFVDSCYSITEALKCYEGRFHPMGHSATWPEYYGPKIIPNMALQRKKGRPKTSRIRNEMDRSQSRNIAHCSNCGNAGHNKKTCPNRAGTSNEGTRSYNY